MSFTLNYFAEATRACEQLRAKTRHSEVLEAQLKALMAQLGLASEAVNIEAPLDPVDGINLRTAAYAPRAALGPVAQAALARQPAHFWPRANVERVALKPAGGHAHARADTSQLRTLGFLALGFDRAHLERALETINAAQENNGKFVPLFVYDGYDFDLLRSRGWVMEWIPPQEDQARTPGSQPWSAYVDQRLAFLKKKWDMIDLICLSQSMFTGLNTSNDEQAAEGKPPRDRQTPSLELSQKKVRTRSRRPVASTATREKPREKRPSRSGVMASANPPIEQGAVIARSSPVRDPGQGDAPDTRKRRRPASPQSASPAACAAE